MTASVPLLMKPSITNAPAKKLPSEEDFLLMLYNESSMGRGFRGVESVCCKLVQLDASCEMEGGCVEGGVPCLLSKMKITWNVAAIPLKSDFNILRILKRIKEKFDKKKINKRLSENNRQAFIDGLRRTTVNLAKEDYEKLINADTLISQTMHAAKIALVKDYIGPIATRSVMVEEEPEVIKNRRAQIAQTLKKRGAGSSSNWQGGCSQVDLPAGSSSEEENSGTGIVSMECSIQGTTGEGGSMQLDCAGIGK